MVKISDSTGNQSQIAGPLAVGLNTVDQDQVVNFTKYYRRVLPIDGSVFWVNSALINIDGKPTSFNARGSLHHTTTNTQDPDESMSVHRMVFTSLTTVDNLAATSPDVLWMAYTAGQRYAFSSRSGWYRQAALYHYSGEAVYPPLSTQIVDTQDQLDLINPVVSNSIPIWLTLNQLFPVYPSYLIPDNRHPPYASVHIDDADTTPMTSGATYGPTQTRLQLVRDRVRVTTYGIRNDAIMDFLDLVQNYALANPGIMGIMNVPTVTDSKRGQVEISALAQKKVIEFHVNYYQQRVNNIARKLILNALLNPILTAG